MPEGYTQVGENQFVSPGMISTARMPTKLSSALDEASSDWMSRGDFQRASELESDRRAYSQRMKTTYR